MKGIDIMKKIIIPLSLILTIILSALNPLIYRIQNRGAYVVEVDSNTLRYYTHILNGYSDFSLEIFNTRKYYPPYPNGLYRTFFDGWQSVTNWQYLRYINIGDFRLRIPTNIKYEPVREKTIQFENTEYTFSYQPEPNHLPAKLLLHLYF